MTAYTTIEFTFMKSKLSKTFVAELYRAVQVQDVAFEKVVPWGCSENMTIEEIIEWNQNKLDSNFEHGDTEDVSNDYRQVLFNCHPYAEFRMYIIYSEDTIYVHIIVPEADTAEFGTSQLRGVSLSVIEKLPVELVQSYSEISDSSLYCEIMEGVADPIIEHFGFIKSLCSESTKIYKIREIMDGYFVERNAA